MLLSSILKAVLAVLALLPEDVNGGEANAGAVCGVTANVGSERGGLRDIVCFRVRACACERICLQICLAVDSFFLVNACMSTYVFVTAFARFECRT